jgi:hypothetical protein
MSCEPEKFAAVAPSLDRLTALVLSETNTAIMNLFLEEASQTFADFFIVMQVGVMQAGIAPKSW